MIAAVRDRKLITLEGDYDHVVNRGSLCVKGMSMFPTHTSPQRLQVPRYRAPGSDRWVDITWDDAVERIARKIRTTRDTAWIATERIGDADVPANQVTTGRGSRGSSGNAIAQIVQHGTYGGVTHGPVAPRFARAASGEWRNSKHPLCSGVP